MLKKLEKATKNYMGCDGGNPESKIWLCGMENGGEYNDANALYKDIEDKIKSNILDVPDVWSGMVKYAHGQHYAALINVIKKNKKEEKFASYKAKSDAILKNNLGTTFKMNLYPIAFKSLEEDALINEFGFESKKQYYEWVEEIRFKKFQNLYEKYKPNLLLCAGLGMGSNFKREFFPDSSSGEDGRCQDTCRLMLSFRLLSSALIPESILSQGLTLQ